MKQTEQVRTSGPEREVLMADDLRKAYGPRLALQGLSFSLKSGHVLGFLGPNGAGKTTSIRILTTMLEPESGYFVVDGIHSEHPEQIRRRIGVLPENLGFPKQMTGIEYLVYFGELYGRTAAAARSYGMTLLEEVGMEQRAKSLIGSYSHGMRQRLGIARALVNDPVVVFLDEPTLGLDPRGQQELLELVKRVARERDAGVVLCSHLLSEIEGVCDDVIILNLGQIVASGPVTEVIGGARKNSLRIEVPAELSESAREVLKASPRVVKVAAVSDKKGWLRVELPDAANGKSSNEYQDNNALLKALITAKIPILSIQPDSGTLQDVFLDLTEESIQ